MQKTSQLVSPLTLACCYRNPAGINVLLNFVDELSFFEAAAPGKLEVPALQFIDDPNINNNYLDDGFTALDIASE